MTTTIVFVMIALALLMSFAYLGTRRRKDSGDFDSTIAAIQALDIEAFRNLVDPEEEAFLRASLPPAQFRKIKRERARAALAYVRELSTVSLQFARLGDAARRSPDPALAASGKQIANSAISLRLRVLDASLRLTVSAALPGLGSRPVRSLLDQYDRTASLLHDHNGLNHARSQAS